MIYLIFFFIKLIIKMLVKKEIIQFIKIKSLRNVDYGVLRLVFYLDGELISKIFETRKENNK